MNWYLYIIECSDESLYTGITKDLERRVSEHNAKNGAKYVKGKLPVKLVYSELYNSHAEALKREIEIKRLNRAEKLKLISGD